jgi:hypothetical protein
MTAYPICITDVFGTIRTPTTGLEITSRLKSWFDPIAHSAHFDRAEILWVPGDTAGFGNLVQVHLLPLELSAIAKLTHAGKFDPLASGHNGRTQWENVDGVEQFLSEVYVDSQDADLIAKLVFHECMHNKLRLTGPQLHPMGGLASAVLGPASRLTPQNANAMAAALGTSRTQWPNVTPFLVERRIRRDGGDPWWYL